MEKAYLPMKTIAALVSASAVFSIISLAQESPDNSPEKKAIMANDRAYEAAYAKGDLKAMADFFADDSHREEWRTYLAGFDAEVYPLFAPFGITRGEALITWQINRVRNALYDLAADPDEDAPWKA